MKARVTVVGVILVMMTLHIPTLLQISLPMDTFEEPPGWTWDGDWFVVSGTRYVLHPTGECGVYGCMYAVCVCVCVRRQCSL